MARIEKRLAALTKMEQVIVTNASRGMTNYASAKELKLSPRTVETYRLRAMLKLRIKHLANLVKFAVKAGLTTLEEEDV